MKRLLGTLSCFLGRHAANPSTMRLEPCPCGHCPRSYPAASCKRCGRLTWLDERSIPTPRLEERVG